MHRNGALQNNTAHFERYLSGETCLKRLLIWAHRDGFLLIGRGVFFLPGPFSRIATRVLCQSGRERRVRGALFDPAGYLRDRA